MNGEDDQSHDDKGLATFQNDDLITEPLVFLALREYFNDDGSPEKVIKALSENFKGYSQACVLLLKWLLELDVDVEYLKGIIDNEYIKLLYSIFNAENAESLLSENYKSTMNTLLNTKLSKEISVAFSNLFFKFPNSKFLKHVVENQQNFQKKNLNDMSSDRSSLEEDNSNYESNNESIKYGPGCTNLLEIFDKINIPIQSFDELKLIEDCFSNGTKQGSYQLGFLSIYFDTEHQNMVEKGSLFFDSMSDISTKLFALKDLVTSSSKFPIFTAEYLDIICRFIFVEREIFNDENQEVVSDIIFRLLQLDECELSRENLLQVLNEFFSFVSDNEAGRHFIKGYKLLMEVGNLHPILTYIVFYWLDYVLRQSFYGLDHSEFIPIFMLINEICINNPYFLRPNFNLICFLLEERPEDIDDMARIKKLRNVIDMSIFLVWCGFCDPILDYFLDKIEKMQIDISLIRYFVKNVTAYIDEKILEKSKEKISQLKSILKK